MKITNLKFNKTFIPVSFNGYEDNVFKNRDINENIIIKPNSKLFIENCIVNTELNLMNSDLYIKHSKVNKDIKTNGYTQIDGDSKSKSDYYCEINANVTLNGVNSKIQNYVQIKENLINNSMLELKGMCVIKKNLTNNSKLDCAAATIYGDLDSAKGGACNLTYTCVHGNLTAPVNKLSLIDSKIYKDIIFMPSNNDNFDLQSEIKRASVMNNSKRAIITTYEGCQKQFNDFIITCKDGKTTVVTPEWKIFVNGKSLDGEDYFRYFADNPDAPKIKGPGWANNSKQVEVFDLKDGNIVLGNIEFKNCEGVVRVHPYAKFKGIVINGKKEFVKSSY